MTDQNLVFNVANAIETHLREGGDKSCTCQPYSLLEDSQALEFIQNSDTIRQAISRWFIMQMVEISKKISFNLMLDKTGNILVTKKKRDNSRLVKQIEKLKRLAAKGNIIAQHDLQEILECLQGPAESVQDTISNRVIKVLSKRLGFSMDGVDPAYPLNFICVKDFEMTKIRDILEHEFKIEIPEDKLTFFSSLNAIIYIVEELLNTADTAILYKVKHFLAEHLGTMTIPADAKLQELVDYDFFPSELAEELEKEFNIRLYGFQLNKDTTVNELAVMIENQLV